MYPVERTLRTWKLEIDKVCFRKISELVEFEERSMSVYRK